MSLLGNNTEEQIWNYLKDKKLNDYGIAGLMGNLYAESGLKPTNLQNSSEKRLGMNDAAYTTEVDNGKYANFAKDSAGYGLAQWTYWTRKQNLLNFARTKGKSIGDLELQLDFLHKELSEGYKGLFNILKTATSVSQASNAVVTQFERPADQSKSALARRAEYGQNYYNKYAGGREMTSSKAVVNTVNSWVGKKESDGSYKSIIDLYNSKAPFPRSVKMQYGWAWCACTWSAVAKKLGYETIMPIEISCFYIVEEAKKLGVWIEADNIVPKPGYAVLYDWDDSGKGDNTGNPDHIGTVVEVYESEGTFVVTEGNYSNSVKKRTLSINGRYIRGFIAPKYDKYDAAQKAEQKKGKTVDVIAREVIAGVWGSGEERKRALEKAGYSYSEVQAKVNQILNEGAIKQTEEVAKQTKRLVASDSAQKYDKTLAGEYKTTSALYLRHGAGTNKKALVCMSKSTKAKCYGYYSVATGSKKWYYVTATVDGVKYTGFCSSAYLKKQ